MLFEIDCKYMMDFNYSTIFIYSDHRNSIALYLTLDVLKHVTNQRNMIEY